MSGDVWSIEPGVRTPSGSSAVDDITEYSSTLVYPYQTVIGEHLEARGLGGSVVLPDAIGLSAGNTVQVSNASTGTVTVSGDVNINDEANYPMALNEVCTFYWDGVQWGIR